MPPANHRAVALQREPCGNIGFVIEIADHDLPTISETLSNGKADQANEGSSIHSKSDFVWVSGIEKSGNCLAGMSDCGVDFPALAIWPSTLHISCQQMMVDRVEHPLRNLRAGSIVE